MSGTICLMIGTMLGGLLGVTVMCFLQINHQNKIRKDSIENEKEKHSEDC